MRGVRLVFWILFSAWFCSGCVNLGDVALIADYEPSSGERGGTYQIQVSGLDRQVLFPAVAQYRVAHPPSAYTVPVSVSVLLLEKSEQEKNNAWMIYEGVSGFLTDLSLGIWPTVKTETTLYLLKIKNETINRVIPVEIQKRCMIGWLSILPVPGWADWRGHERYIGEGETQILLQTIEDNLRLEDYRKCLINWILRGKDVQPDINLRSIRTLRQYALQHVPEKWRNVQQIRAETSLVQQNIRQLHEGMITPDRSLWDKSEFNLLCGQYFMLLDRQCRTMTELEKLYYAQEAVPVSARTKHPEDVSLEEILKGMNGKR